jgi:hypothetical protein
VLFLTGDFVQENYQRVRVALCLTLGIHRKSGNRLHGCRITWRPIFRKQFDASLCKWVLQQWIGFSSAAYPLSFSIPKQPFRKDRDYSRDI